MTPWSHCRNADGNTIHHTSLAVALWDILVILGSKIKILKEGREPFVSIFNLFFFLP
jgi:hypothetical protein